MKYILNKNDYKSVRELPLLQQPREKLRLSGVESLSDSDLLCILMRMGTKGHKVNELAQKVLSLLEENKEITVSSLQKIEGMGYVSSASVCAALELGRRFKGISKKAIRNSMDVFNELRHFGDREQELFIVVLLNGALEIIDTKVITVGLVNRTLVHPREVFKEAIRKTATAIIIAHNHPSGFLEPSDEDIELTLRIQKAGNLLGIEVLDHFIFSSEKFYSMKESGYFM